MSAKIFETEFLRRKEFEGLYQKIIPSLNQCGNCGILKNLNGFIFNLNCMSCRLWRCKNCQMFKNSKWLLFEKFTIKQWNYIANFLHDFFQISDYSFDFFSHLKPIDSKVKENNEVFLCQMNNNNKKYKNKSSNKIYYFINKRKYYFKK